MPIVDNRRTIEIFVNTESGDRVSQNGFNTKIGSLSMFRKSQTLFRCHLLLADNVTPFRPETGSTWNFNMDSVYDPTHEDPVASDNAQFNIAADWDELAVDNGKICFRVNTTSTQLQTLLGDNAQINMAGELWMTPPTGDPVLLVQMPIVMKNIVSDIGATSSLVYSLTSLIGFDGEDTVIYLPDGTVAHRYTP